MEKPGRFYIRTAVPGDEAAVGRVVLGTWKTAYRGIVDGAFLDALDERDEKRLARYRERIAEGHILLAEEPGAEKGGGAGATPAGAAVFGPAREEPYAGWGELYALYVLEGRQRAGAGRLLVEAVEERLREQGYGKMVIECLTANPSCGFYARMGGQGKSDGVCTLGGRGYPLTAFSYDLRA